MKKLYYNDESIIGELNSIKDLNEFKVKAIEILKKTDSAKIRNDLAINIVDKIQSNDVFDALLELMSRSDLQGNTGTIAYALSEMDLNTENTDELLNLLLNGSFHVAWNLSFLFDDLILSDAQNDKLLKAIELNDEKKEIYEEILKGKRDG